MVTHKLNTLTDLARNGYWLRVSCSCGHVTRIDPAKLATRLASAGKSTRLASLPLKCSRCGGRDFDATATFGETIESEV